MSNMCKKMAKKMDENKRLIFPTSMYGNVLGSLVISAYILSENKEEYDTAEISRLWNKVEKKPQKYINFGFDDEEFVDKALKMFGINKPSHFPIAMVCSKYNTLFAPYINGELYPLREDGFIPQTFKTGKVYPIDFNKIKEA